MQLYFQLSYPEYEGMVCTPFSMNVILMLGFCTVGKKTQKYDEWYVVVREASMISFCTCALTAATLQLLNFSKELHN